MSSGSYFPKAVREKRIPKYDGTKRSLGIPTITDRVAQQVVKEVLEPRLEKLFHPNSYGYRSGKSAHQAVQLTEQRCWAENWVIDMDIQGFFDNIDHELMLEAVSFHINPLTEKWILLYIERWLKAPILLEEGEEGEHEDDHLHQIHHDTHKSITVRFADRAHNIVVDQIAEREDFSERRVGFSNLIHA